MQQVAMCRVQLDQVEPCLQSALCGRGERSDNALYSCEVQCYRLSEVFPKTNRAGGHHILPPAFTRGQKPLLFSTWTRHAGLAPRVRQLHPCASTLTMNKCNHSFQLCDVIVFPQSQVLRRDPALGKNSRRFGKHQPCATHGTASQ